MRNLSLLLLFSGCTAGGAGGSVGNVVELSIEPTSVALTTSSDSPQTQDFRAIATFQNGETDDDYPLVGWSLTNTAAGGINNDGLFTTSLTNGGVTSLLADANGIQATAEITVIFDEEVEDEGIDPSAQAIFDDEPQSAPESLVWAYPEDNVALPKNLPEFTFMWTDTLGASLYRLTFSSSTTHVSVVTDQTSWTAPKEIWKVITATNAGGEVTVSLEAASGTLENGTISNVTSLYAGDDISFKVNRFDAIGAVYYWSVAESGVVRSDISEVEPAVWFGPTAHNTTWCVGCHVLSPDATQMAFSWQLDGERGFRMSLADLDENSVPTVALEMDTTRDEGNFSTWSPDGAYVVFSGSGGLHVYDGSTGEFLWDVESELSLTQPNWSPDGEHLVAVSATKYYDSDTNFQGGELVVFDVDENAQFGDSHVLVEELTGINQYYPMYSPDGKWVVFNRSGGPSYFAEDASLWLVNAEGGDAIKLENANQGNHLTNSWPRWGPIPDDDVLWLAFASRRDYGTASEDETAHIWVSAIDTTKAEQGDDPSSPAFWLVQQVVGGGNHAPWWGVQ